jgi:hypothetical protein
MKRSSLAAVLGISAAMVFGGAALAQTGDNSSPPVTTPPPATVPVSDQAATQATTATSTADAKLAEIEARGKATPEKEAKTAETKLDATKATVDKEATDKGDNTVAGRLATEFGMTPDALTAEKAQFNTGWGDLMIAHSITNAKSDVTMAQLFQMRTDGMGWGQIANGLDLRIGDLVSSAAADGRVATGHAKADGMVAAIHAKGASATHAASAAHAHGATAAKAGMGAGTSTAKGHAGK